MRYRSKLILTHIVISALLACALCLSALADHPLSLKGLKVPPEQLESQIAARMQRVDLFRFVRGACQELRIRCWMVGGTASSFAHYVKWDLAREAGNKRLRNDRFQYHLDQIIRSTQDLDFAVDGPPGSINTLKARLESYFSQAAAPKIDVASLRHPAGEQPALLSTDFLDQHNDSHSLGAIEITPPPAGESVARDLRVDWDGTARVRSGFIDDVANGNLRYHYSPRHASTSRAAKNPELLSVVRTYIKKLQFDLELSSEDTAKLRSIIRQTPPQSYSGIDYVDRWMKSNAPKLVRHAANIEEAVKELDEIGLRPLLAHSEDLRYWMSWDPLPFKRVGAGTGSTAAALGLAKRKITHNAPYEAFESILWSPTGKAAFLPSDPKLHGSNRSRGVYFGLKAGHDWGGLDFISLIGQLKPAAREGTDFLFDPKQKDVVVLLNPEAFVPDPVNAGPGTVLEYFQTLAATDPEDRARLSRLALQKRRLIGQYATLSPSELKQLSNIVEAAIKFEEPTVSLLLQDGFEIPKLRPLVEEALTRQFSLGGPKARSEITGLISRFGGRELIARIIDGTTSAEHLADWGFFFSDPESARYASQYAKVIRAVAERKRHLLRPIAYSIFRKAHAPAFEEAFRELIAEADWDALRVVSDEVLTLPQWSLRRYDYLREAASVAYPERRRAILNGGRTGSQGAWNTGSYEERPAREPFRSAPAPASHSAQAGRLSDAELDQWLKDWKARRGRGPTAEEAKEAVRFLYPGMSEESVDTIVKTLDDPGSILKNARAHAASVGGCLTTSLRRLLLLSE